MAFLCDWIRNAVFYSCNCDKMVAVVLCSCLRIRPCVVQSFLYWRQHTGLLRPSNLVVFLRLQDVCLDVDRSYGSRDKAVGKKAHATGFVTNFFSIEDFSVFVNKQHEICLCTCFHSEQIVDSAIRIRTCILLPSVVTVALPTCRKRLSSGSVLYV